MSLTILDLSSPHVSKTKNLDHRAQAVTTRLGNVWIKQGIKLRPGLNRSELERFESKLNIRFPNDLREYFLLADGFDGEMDDECIAFFSLQEAIEASEIWRSTEAESAGLFAFADFLISSHVYMIDLATREDGSNPIYCVYDSKPEWMRKAANSFSDFVNGCVEHDFTVLFPK